MDRETKRWKLQKILGLGQGHLQYDMDYFDYFSRRACGGLAQELSGTTMGRIEQGSSIARLNVLLEINHFFCHHCSLPVVLRAIREIYPEARFVPYVPLTLWDQNVSTLQFVLGFYRSMGVEEEIVKASPNSEQINRAKSIVVENFTYFSGSIRRLSDFYFDGYPLGVHLAESILQQLRVVDVEQTEASLLQSVSLIARYLWWKEYIEANDVGMLLGSHPCYEFSLPLLAGLRGGARAYLFSNNYLFDATTQLPLPLASFSPFREVKDLWNRLQPSRKTAYMQDAQLELAKRVRGQKTGSLLQDVRVGGERTHKIPMEIANPNNWPVVTIYCHAFSDAPCLLPPARFSYLASPFISTTALLETLSVCPVITLIKTHPSNFYHDELALEQLLSQFPKVLRVPSSATVEAVKDLGTDVIVTGWGSITNEASYLGIPVLSYADFHKIATPLPIQRFTLGDPDSFMSALALAISSPPIPTQAVEIYAATEMGLCYDLTCSRGNPRDESVWAEEPQNTYDVWADTFEREKFQRTLNLIIDYFKERRRVLSEFVLEVGV